MDRKTNNKRISKKLYKTKNQRRSKRTKFIMAGGGFSISIKTLSGKIVRLSDIRADTTVDKIKEMLVEPTGIQSEQQRLIFDGKQLTDGFPLSVYDIKSGSTVYLVLRIRGGMHHPSSTGSEALDFPQSPTSPPSPPSLSELVREANSVKSGREIYSMGFRIDKVLRALNEADNDQDRAIELLLAESSSPIAAPEHDREIFKMGFDPRLVTAALAQTANDEQTAISLILDGFHSVLHM